MLLKEGRHAQSGCEGGEIYRYSSILVIVQVRSSRRQVRVRDECARSQRSLECRARTDMYYQPHQVSHIVSRMNVKGFNATSATPRSCFLSATLTRLLYLRHTSTSH